MYYNTILTSRDLSRYFNIFTFMRRIESAVKIQRWWRKLNKKNKDNIQDIILR